MKNGIQHKRIPTLLGFILLILTLGTTSYLVRGNTNFLSNAAPDATPQHVLVTNVSDSSFTVTYMTTSPALGSIQYASPSQQSKLVNDERDTAGPSDHEAHSIIVKNLRPHTAYQFTILSNGKTYTNNGASYRVFTPATLPPRKESLTSITGSVVTPDQTPLGEAQVVISGDSFQPISTLVKENGTFVLSVASLRTKDLQSLIQLSDTAKLTITVRNANYTGVVTTTYGQTHPVPLITLTQTFDFTTNSALFFAQNATSSADLSSLPASNTQKSTPQQPTIITPYKNQKFTDSQPNFTGNALPYSKVTITIHSAGDITTSVSADAAGTWKYRPAAPLASGSHTITISSKDAFGIMKTLMQPFTVLAAGSQIDAAPSVAPVPNATATPTPQATVTPTPTGTPVPTATPTTIPTATPTQTPGAIDTPTVAPTATPTLLPTATPTSVPTLQPTQIASGPTATLTPLNQFKTGSSVSVLAAIIGGVLTALGLTLFVLSRGSGFL